MKRSITVQIPEEKLSAIEMYLEQKNTTLAAALDAFVNKKLSHSANKKVSRF